MSMRVLFEEQLKEAPALHDYLGARSIDQAVMEQVEKAKKIGADVNIANARAFVEFQIADYEAHRGQKAVFAILDDGEQDDGNGGTTLRLMIIKLWEDELDTLHERYYQSHVPSGGKLPRLVKIR